MFRKARISALTSILVLVALALPLLAADDGVAPAAASHPAGFFERNFVLAEIIFLPIFMVLIAIAMASDTTTETIETRTTDIYNKPLYKSYTTINVPKEPSTPQEIRHALIAFCVIYPLLRFTCLFGFLNGFYQFLGGCIDIFLS